MDRKALIEKVKELGPWFHSVDLGANVRTREIAPLPGPQPVDHPRKRWVDLVDAIPSDLSGQRVLDIGCADGFYSIEFAKRNALEVVAVDPWRKHIDRIEWLREHLDLPNITPVVGSLEQIRVDDIGEFDVVFMLGLLYHLKDPLTGLEAVSKLSNVLWLESITVFDEENPYLYLKPPAKGVHHVSKWIPTTRCVRDMLQMVGFASVEEITQPYHSRPEGPYKNRPIFVARKWLQCPQLEFDGPDRPCGENP
ncbi:MAG: DUF1698 domain-containing protein [Rhodospirillaceae bacterium]|nr:DUF1698 domain-containing protein [Rhodospirillaceae bacterium]